MKKSIFIFCTFILVLTISKDCFSQNWKIEYDSAKANFNNWKVDKTTEWLERFLPAYRTNYEDTILLHEMFNLMGKCYMFTGKAKEAEELFKENIEYYGSEDLYDRNPNYQSAIHNLANLQYHLNRYDEAYKNYLLAYQIKVLHYKNQRKEIINLVSNLATIARHKNQFDKADSLYQMVADLKIETYGAKSLEYSNTLLTLGSLYKKNGNFQKAEPYFKKAMEIRNDTLGKESPEYIAAFKHLANLYYTQGKYNESEPMYKEIINLSKTTFGEPSPEEIIGINDLAHQYTETNRYFDALPLYEEALKAEENLNGKESSEYGNALLNLAILYRTMSRFGESESMFMNVKSIYEKTYGKNHERYVAALIQIAGLYRNMGRFEEAEPFYLQAQDIHKNNGEGENSLSYANILNNIALFYDFIGKYESAEFNYKQSLQITKEKLGQENADYATTLNNIAQLYKNMGKFDQSEPIYLESIQIRKKVLSEIHPDYATSLNNLASLYQSMGRYNEAEPLYKQSVEIIKNVYGVNNPHYASGLNNLAGLYEMMNRYNESEELYNQSLEIISRVLGAGHPDYLATLNNLALLQQRLGNYVEAEKMYKQNIEKTKADLGTSHPNYAASLSNLASLYEKTTRYSDAQLLFEEVLEVRRKSLGINHPAFNTTLANLARLYTLLKMYNKADEFWEQAIKNYIHEINTFFPTMSEREKAMFFQTISKFFEQYNSYVLLRLNENPMVLATMYNNQLTTKALLLNSSNKVRKRIFSSKDQTLIKNYKNWQSQKEYLAKLYTMPKDDVKKQKINVDSLEAANNSLEKKLTSSSEIFRKNSEKQVFDWKDIQKKLKKNEAAVEIIRFNKYKFDSAGYYTDTAYYAALIVRHQTENHPEMVFFDHGAEMETKFIKRYKNTIKFKVEDPLSYNTYWKEIQEKVGNAKKVYVSPDGVYNSLNINTLYDIDTKKFVFDKLDIQMVSNTKDLLIAERKRNPNKDIFLGGNPDFLFQNATNTNVVYKSELSQLPGTEKEVQLISGLMERKNWKTKLFTGKLATEENIKSMENPRVIHIATHGFFEKDAPDNEKNQKKIKENPLFRSGLLLAGASITIQNRKLASSLPQKAENITEDGILTAYEAMNLNLDNTELVVLSACETGVGEIKNGEGVYGLQRSFLVAGTKALIISLWKVNDETTQKLMTYFYENWSRNSNIREAFHDAQEKLKIEFPEPYYWGAFLILGE